MDLCADMLVKHATPGAELEMSLPRYRKLLGFLPSKRARNFDRWYNRWKVYPAHVEKLSGRPGCFHIVDHSYAHLANHLPDGRVGVYCHDLDAFRCILEPENEKRPDWFQKMMGRVLDGLIRARLIFCSTDITRKKLVELGHWKPEFIKVVPYGVAEEFKPDGPREVGNYILHVGSCIPRKRMDVLLEAFDEMSKTRPTLRLIQAGGTFSPSQLKQIRDLNLDSRVEQRQNLTREDLARLYRGAKCLVISSDAEGYGLPVIEGLSCGAPVVTSDIPALREVGGMDISYFPVGDTSACAIQVLKILDNPVSPGTPPSEKWSWSTHACQICQAYESLGINE